MCEFVEDGDNVFVSTHSRLKAAGNTMIEKGKAGYVSTHSRLKAAGIKSDRHAADLLFQHTAA